METKNNEENGVLRERFALAMERIGEIGWSDNTAVTELMWDGAWHVLRENDASHLTEDCRPDNRTSFWK